jgi:hypothetical protein
MQPLITTTSKLKQKVKDRYIDMTSMKTPLIHIMKLLLIMNPLTLILLLKPYKPMLRATALHQIKGIITIVFKCPRTYGLALMIKQRPFGIA